MSSTNLLMTAMAEECRRLIETFGATDDSLPGPIHPNHLKWMCRQVETHAERWPSGKLNRWIGFIQCGMLANRIVDLQELKRMFDAAKVAYGKRSEDFVDHLDSSSGFGLEIGGEC